MMRENGGGVSSPRLGELDIDEVRADESVGASEPVNQAEIDDVLRDPTLSAADRQARLEDLRQRLIEGEGQDYGGEYTPLETRLMDALSMLADGGHDYGAIEAPDIGPEGRSDSGAPDEEPKDESA